MSTQDHMMSSLPAKTTSSRPCLRLGVYGVVPTDTLSEVCLDLEDGHTLLLYQAKLSISLGGWVYDGAACLAKYVEKVLLETETSVRQGKSLVELGAGTGTVGLVAAHYGLDVAITDLNELVPLLQHNIDMNQHRLTGKIAAKPLRWGGECSGFKAPVDYLILANCVYYDSSMEPLLETMLELTDKRTQIYVCYEIRTADIGKLIDRWHALIQDFFEVVVLPEDVICATFKQDFVKLVQMKRK